jgi:hypothetical protein
MNHLSYLANAHYAVPQGLSHVSPTLIASMPFHKFLLLPQELQTTIWDIAVRPDVPAAHTFSLMIPRRRANKVKIAEQYSVLPLSQKRWREFQDGGAILTLAAPDYHGNHSWTRSNTSAYMIDSGLWTACKASRDAMFRRFKPEAWKPARRAFWNRAKGTQVEKLKEPAPDAPVTGWFQTAPKQKRFLTIKPHSDLVVLRLEPDSDRSLFKWDHFLLRTSLLSLESGTQLRNLGIELDDKLLAEIEYDKLELSRSATCLIELLVGVSTGAIQLHDVAPRIWIVDKRFQRGRFAPMQQDWDDSWPTQQLTTFCGKGGEYVSSPDEHAHLIRDALTRALDTELMRRERTRRGCHHHHQPPGTSLNRSWVAERFGVLMWVPLR